MAVMPAGCRCTSTQVSQPSTLKPFSRNKWASRSREPRVQAATTVRRPCPAQVAACSPSCWKALAPVAAPALVNT